MNNFVKGFKEGKGFFEESMAFLVSAILLSVIYVVGVGASALVAKLTKKEFLQTRINKETKTYWSDLQLTKQPLEHYYRQF